MKPVGILFGLKLFMISNFCSACDKKKEKEDKICINLNLIYVHNLDGYSFVKDK